MSWHSRDLIVLEKINKSIIKLNQIKNSPLVEKSRLSTKESRVKRITSILAGEGAVKGIYGGDSCHATKKQGYMPSSHPAAYIPQPAAHIP